MSKYNLADRYQHTTRKVFDKHIDRIEIKRQRDLKDHRADLKAIFNRIINLEQALQDLADHVSSHCTQLEEDRDTPSLERRAADMRDS